MEEAPEIAARLQSRGVVRVLDLGQAASARGVYDEEVHNGIYYMLPPEGESATTLREILDEYRDRDVIHFMYAVQSGIEVNHKPLIPLDRYIERFFGKPAISLLKVTAIARQKVAELETLLTCMKKPFDAATFPSIDQLELSKYRPPEEGRQTVVSMKVLSEDWRQLNLLDEAIRIHLAESLLAREISVSRHAVKGFQPEILLSSTASVTPVGNTFLQALASHLDEHGGIYAAAAATRQTSVDSAADVPDHSFMTLTASARERATDSIGSMSAPQLYKAVLTTMGETLKTMGDFAKLQQTMTGPMLLVEFPSAGLLGTKGHFEESHRKTLQSVYRVARLTPKIGEGWSAHYRYDKKTRMLSIKVGDPREGAPADWIELR